LKDYSATLKDGSLIYIAQWPATVAYTNLGLVCEVFPDGLVEQIAESKNQVLVMSGLMNAKDPGKFVNIMQHFVCTAAMDGQRIQPGNYDSTFEDDFAKATEVFAHCISAVYSDFFGRGLAEANSQAS
jgi:hypothetical protein